MERVQSLAHDLLEAGDQHFRIATQPARVVFWMAGTSGACELVSGNWHDFSGQRMDDALGQGWLDVVEPQDRAELLHFSPDINPPGSRLARNFVRQQQPFAHPQILALRVYDRIQQQTRNRRTKHEDRFGQFLEFQQQSQRDSHLRERSTP